MPIKDEEILELIDKIKDHYHNNINNRFIRKALIHLKLPREDWEAVERFTEKTDYYKIQGYRYKELYEQIHGAASFIAHAKTDVLPQIKTLLSGGAETILSRQRGGTDSDRILRSMAINNFSANLGIFADMLNELYIKIVHMDKEDHKGSKPIYERMPELREIGQLLV